MVGWKHLLIESALRAILAATRHSRDFLGSINYSIWMFPSFILGKVLLQPWKCLIKYVGERDFITADYCYMLRKRVIIVNCVLPKTKLIRHNLLDIIARYGV